MSKLKSSLEQTKTIMKASFIVIFIIFIGILATTYLREENNLDSSVLGTSDSNTLTSEFILRRYIDGPTDKPLIIENLLLLQLNFETYPSIYTDSQILAAFIDDGSLTKDFETYLLSGSFYLETKELPIMLRIQSEDMYVGAHSVVLANESSKSITVLKGNVRLQSGEQIEPEESASFIVDRHYKTEQNTKDSYDGSRILSFLRKLGIETAYELN